MYLVPQPLTSNDCDLIANPLVGFKVKSKLWVISLDNRFSRLLDSLGPDYLPPGKRESISSSRSPNTPAQKSNDPPSSSPSPPH